MRADPYASDDESYGSIGPPPEAPCNQLGLPAEYEEGVVAEGRSRPNHALAAARRDAEEARRGVEEARRDAEAARRDAEEARRDAEEANTRANAAEEQVLELQDQLANARRTVRFTTQPYLQTSFHHDVPRKHSPCWAVVRTATNDQGRVGNAPPGF